MAKTRTTLTIDEEVLRSVKVRAARVGKGESEFIEEVLRRELGFDLLDRLWEASALDADTAMNLALEAQRAVRRSKR